LRFVKHLKPSQLLCYFLAVHPPYPFLRRFYFAVIIVKKECGALCPRRHVRKILSCFVTFADDFVLYDGKNVLAKLIYFVF